MKSNKSKKSNKEDGQSMLEFVLVLPVFLLMLFMILDFGWLFYNMSTVENAARNAARIACVEYDNTCYVEGANGTKEYASSADYDLASISNYTVQEQNILNEVSSSLNDTSSTTKVHIQYSGGASLEDRQSGDVTVKVSYVIHVFTPVLGIGSDGMKRTITTSSTFKVEDNGSNSSDISGG